MADKYSALWVSHSSIGDFLRCPRAYYLNNVYKDPRTVHKIQLMSPALALGGAVHEVLESLSIKPTKERFTESLVKQFNQLWQRKYSGEQGGFHSDELEQSYQEKGQTMLRRVMENPGPLKNLAVKISEDLPQYWLSEEDEIILCGKVDWLEYLEEQDAVHIIDFKTGRKREDEESLQLPIYHLLVHNTQKRKVAKASYWYLATEDQPEEKELPSLADAREKVIAVAKKMKLARKLERFKCPEGEVGCRYCQPLEKILAGEARQVGVSQYKQDVYILPELEIGENESVIL